MKIHFKFLTHSKTSYNMKKLLVFSNDAKKTEHTSVKLSNAIQKWRAEGQKGQEDLLQHLRDIKSIKEAFESLAEMLP